MILSEALAHHRAALSASLRAEYGIRLSDRTESWFDVADYVAWLPAGSPLWVSLGGPAALTPEAEQLRWVDYRLRMLWWGKTEDGKSGRNRPAPPTKVEWAHERTAKVAERTQRVTAWQRRQALRNPSNTDD
jgi:hypothetical protein